jgi:hypothetical protein
VFVIDRLDLSSAWNRWIFQSVTCTSVRRCLGPIERLAGSDLDGEILAAIDNDEEMIGDFGRMKLNPGSGRCMSKKQARNNICHRTINTRYDTPLKITKNSKNH